MGSKRGAARIISDFDGVLTAQEAEAEAVGRCQLDWVSQVMGDRGRAEALLERCRAQVRADPAHHGWVVGGQLTCYADEDPYVFHNAAGQVLYETAPEAVLRDLAAMGMPTPDIFCGRAFVEGTEAWRAVNASHLDPDSVALFEALDRLGIEVVVVSNSTTDRIERIFADFGTDHFHGTLPRVRGGARKFVATPERVLPLPTHGTFGPRDVLLHRGFYYDILMEERPLLVIGDVLSLDLALPVTLRDEVPGFERLQICFRRAAHTPAWALDAARARGIHIVDSLLVLPELLAGYGSTAG